MKLMFHRPRGYSRASPRWMQPRARFSKFVIQRGTLGNELRKPKGTSNSMILVPLFDLKFLKRTRGTRCRNFKSAALAPARGVKGRRAALFEIAEGEDAGAKLRE